MEIELLRRKRDLATGETELLRRELELTLMFTREKIIAKLDIMLE